VLPKDHMSFWDELVTKFKFKIPHKIVEGGKERFFSIQNGLNSANGDLIGIHDGVRPFVSVKVIQSVFAATMKYNVVIPVVDLKESIRRRVGEIESKAVDRSAYKIVQTPQCFIANIIKEAYLQEYSKEFTDDASVVEKMGTKIHLVKGNDENIKITTPMDLKLASILA